MGVTAFRLRADRLHALKAEGAAAATSLPPEPSQMRRDALDELAIQQRKQISALRSQLEAALGELSEARRCLKEPASLQVAAVQPPPVEPAELIELRKQLAAVRGDLTNALAEVETLTRPRQKPPQPQPQPQRR